MHQFSWKQNGGVQETEFDVLRREFQAEVEQHGCRATSGGKCFCFQHGDASNHRFCDTVFF